MALVFCWSRRLKNGKVIRAVGKPFCFEIDDSKIKKESVAKKQTDSKKD